jgi:predicted TIM-barrel fold metal-dependent hydrolase
MIRPEEAAKEAKRCFEELNFVGIILNDYQSVSDEEAPDFAEPSEVDGKRLYYDNKSYDVFFKVLEDAGKPFYCHPRLIQGQFFKSRPWLAASVHGFKIQASHHILALITGGLFDRFPKVGHVRMMRSTTGANSNTAVAANDVRTHGRGNNWRSLARRSSIGSFSLPNLEDG